MKLRNNFTTETRELFRDVQYSCFECGGNGQECGGTSIHHILGRISDSPLNGAVLCGNCHSKCGHSFSEESEYLKQTIKYLVKIEYKFTEDDCLFFKENSKYYND